MRTHLVQDEFHPYHSASDQGYDVVKESSLVSHHLAERLYGDCVVQLHSLLAGEQVVGFCVRGHLLAC